MMPVAEAREGIVVAKEQTLVEGRGGVARAQSAVDLDQAAPCRVAYLVNAYPKISHSFIRTEIAALERAGLEVERVTIRRSELQNLDSADRAEALRTTVLLHRDAAILARDVLARFRIAPGAAVKSLADAVGRGWPGQYVRACAAYVEAASLCELMRRKGIRHIHAHFGTNSAAVARLAARMGGLSYSFTVHGPDEFDAPRQLDLAGKIADAAFVVAISSYGRGQLMRWAKPADWHKIKLVRCAVSPLFLEEREGAGSGFRSRRFVCVARLDPQKGLPLLLSAVAAIPTDRAFEVDIIGDGDGRTSIEQQIAQLGLQHRVRLLGWKPAEDVRRHVEECRAFLLPSFAEGLPVVLMEAMALGRPVIATAVAGIPELVDARNGWLVASGSVGELVQAIEAALDATPQRLRSMGEAGRLRVCGAHHPDLNAILLADYLRPHL